MKKKKWFAFSMTAVLAASLFAGCSSGTGGSSSTTSGGSSGTGGSSTGTGAAPAPAKSVKGELVNIATATTGGVYYPLGNALAKLWTDKIGVKGSAQTTAGTAQNINLMEKKEAEIAFAQNGVVTQAMQGIGPFKDHTQKDLRSITYLYPNIMHFLVRKDSGINSIKDLEGKKIVPGSVGSATEINTMEIIGEYGLDYKDKKNVKADFVGYNEAADLMKNRQADMAMIAGSTPTSSILDMASSFDMKILSLEPDMIKKISEKYPWYFEVVIPKNSYKGQTEDVHTVAVANILIVRKDLSDELVYQLTKSIYENTNDLIAAHDAAKYITLDHALDGLTAPLHPGAEKFYKEKGLDTSKVMKAN